VLSEVYVVLLNTFGLVAHFIHLAYSPVGSPMLTPHVAKSLRVIRSFHADSIRTSLALVCYIKFLPNM
jgi:hypothetical protein